MNIKTSQMDACSQSISTITCRRPKSLELNKRIFLSHSGKDKPFVRRLYKALKQRKYDVFFDEDILPKAERITMKEILEEVEISELCVFVISDAFFTVTKNPMLELGSFLTAQDKDPMKRLLPLFYKLSVPQFKDTQIQCKWIEEWEKWEKKSMEKGFAISDVNLEKWKAALKIIGETNGVEMNESNDEEEYIEVIVSHICRIIKPDGQYDLSHVQGKERMCKEVDDLFVKCEKDPTRACILGIHGLGGLGKTTLSQVLFNYYWSQFEGRVVRIELDSFTKEGNLEQLRMVLETIKNTHEQTLASLHYVDEAWRLYLNSTSRKKVFLIIDNANLIWKEEIGKYLKCKVDKESRILILSRSKTLLEDLCLGYPNFHLAKTLSLRKEEAEAMFLQGLQKFGIGCELSTRELDSVRDGINLCLFEGVYHPLAVLVLGSWMSQKDWEDIVTFLSKHRTSKLGSKVIDLLKKSFDQMEEMPQRILLDLALYRPSPHLNWNPCEWLSFVNEIDQVEVKNVLKELRDRAFLCGNGLEIHELVKELAVLATRTNTSLGCLYFDKNNQLWERMGDNANSGYVRFAMESCEIPISTLSLKGCHWLRAVKIKDIKGLKKIKMEQNMVCLHSLEVSSSQFMNSLRNDDQMKSKKNPCSAIIMIKSLGCCVNLKWMSLENCVDSILMQPQSLRRFMSLVRSGSRLISLHSVRMVTDQRFAFPLQTLDKCCSSLEKLELDGFDVGKLCRLPKFSQVRSLSLIRCLWTRELHIGSHSRLERFDIRLSPKLKRICALEDCTSSLLTFYLSEMRNLEYLGLSALHHLSSLYIFGCGKLNRLEGLEKMDSLKEMKFRECNGLVRLVGLEKLGSLKYLDVRYCAGLVSLFEGVVREDEHATSALNNLRYVDIWGCPNLTEKFGIVNVNSFERGFLKMLMVALCWSSQAQITDITQKIQATKCTNRYRLTSMRRPIRNRTMTTYLSLVHNPTLLTCLVYLWCHGQTPSFLIILQMAGGINRIFNSWGQPQDYRNSTSYRKSRIQHGILLLTMVGILRPDHLPDLAIHIATIYLSTLLNMKIVLDKEDKNFDLTDIARLPLIAKEAMLRLLNEESVQREFQNVQREVQKDPREFQKQREFQESIEGVDNLEVFNRLLHDIPCWYDLECFLSYSDNYL